jgi:hypothetical protein
MYSTETGKTKEDGESNYDSRLQGLEICNSKFDLKLNLEFIFNAQTKGERGKA